jgi:hypothetical protein
MTGSSTQGAKTLLHPVSDLESAKAVYTALLGVAPQVADAYYVGSKPRPAHRTGAGRRAAGHDFTGGLLARVGHGGEAGRGDRRGRHPEDPARDVGGGRSVATVTDPDGNVLGLLQDT